MFEGIICSELRARDRRAQGKMSGPDGSNQLRRQWCQPPSQLEHLVWGRTRGQARSKQRAGVGQVPVFSENLKDQGDEVGLLEVHCGCSGYREGPVTSSEEPLPCTGALTSKLLSRELGLRPCTDLLTVS